MLKRLISNKFMEMNNNNLLTNIQSVVSRIFVERQNIN